MFKPFAVSVGEDVLSDLQSRIRNTRWPDQAPGVAWGQGTDLSYLQGLLAYWADEFDWRAQELNLNRFKHFHADIDGLQIHFVHAKAKRGHGIPLILTHGWPSTFLEMLPLVPLLTTITLYWATQTITSSMRDYYDNRWTGVKLGLKDQVRVPTGVAPFDHEYIPEGSLPREWAERLYNIRRWTPMPRGGHFAAVEEPMLLSRDIAAFFSTLKI